MTEPSTRRESSINQWVRLNKLLVAYRYALVVLSTVLLGFLGLTFGLINRDTLVVGLAGHEKLFFIGQRGDVSITENDVTEISKLFIQTRYVWSTLRLDNLAKELAPITSAGLLQKIEADLSKNRALVSQKGLAQDVIIRTIKLDDGKVLALIDRVIQLNEKMKVVSPLELTLTLIRAQPNRFNPLGLYVNTVMEHEVE